jgi:hypothetical protein
MLENNNTHRYEQCLLVLLLCVVGNSAQCANGYYVVDYNYRNVITFDFTGKDWQTHPAYAREIGATMTGSFLDYPVATLSLVLPTSSEGTELNQVRVQVSAAGSSYVDGVVSMALDGNIKLSFHTVAGMTLTKEVTIPYESGGNVLTITKSAQMVLKPAMLIRLDTRVSPNCRACAVNTYMAVQNDTACTPCPQNSFSHAGSTLITDCICKAGFITTQNASNATQQCFLVVGNYAQCGKGAHAVSYDTIHVNTFDFTSRDTIETQAAYAIEIGAIMSGHFLEYSAAKLLLVLPTSYNGIELNEVRVRLSSACCNSQQVSIALDDNVKLSFYTRAGDTVYGAVTIPYELGKNILTITKSDSMTLRTDILIEFYTRVSSNCSPCAVNTYKAEVSDAACTPCPTNSHSPGNSTSIMFCTCDAGYISRRNTSNATDYCVACTIGKIQPFA